DCVHALDHVVINTPNPDRALALYGARLGLDFRLDRSNPEWGSRLLFFRCGDSVVEIGAGLKSPVSDAPDRLTGLAWRGADPQAAQARLAADQIIPEQFLKSVDRDGMAKGLFYDLRFGEAGREKPDCVRNDRRYARAGVLIAGDNFGCGSSREHAAWALLDFGIRCVIAP